MDWGSIVHFTAGGDCCNFGDRSPGIWFQPGTTQLHVRVGDTIDGNWGIDTDALPLNTYTPVTLVCKGADVNMTVGTNTYTAKQPTRRFSGGNLTVYAGDPWYAAANATVANLDYQILPADEAIKPLLPANPALVRGNQIATISETTGNYMLSFDIKPTNNHTDCQGSVLHFTAGGDCCSLHGISFSWYLDSTWYHSTACQCRRFYRRQLGY